jgi:hypothetical protein
MAMGVQMEGEEGNVLGMSRRITATMSRRSALTSRERRRRSCSKMSALKLSGRGPVRVAHQRQALTKMLDCVGIGYFDRGGMSPDVVERSAGRSLMCSVPFLRTR